ncbi:MAG: site-specific integrase [Terriglobales bacterium]
MTTSKAAGRRTRKGRERGNGEGGLILRGRIWWCQYYQDGRQIRVSTKTHVRSEALAFLRKAMDSRDKGEVPATDIKKLTYADLRQSLIDSYVALGNKSLKERADGTETIAGLAALDEFCGFKQGPNGDGKITVTDGGATATQLTTDFARRFVKERKTSGIGNAAINRSLAALRRMLKLAKREKKIHDVPFIEFLKEPSARKGFLELDKFNELIGLLPTHLRPLVTFLYYDGVRIGEALQVEWSQVNLDARTIRLEEEQTKGDEARTLPLPSVLVNMLNEVTPKSGRVFDGTNLRKEWVTACAAAELGTLTEVEGRPYDPLYSGLTLHDLRRSAVRNLVNAGVPERVAMKITGHKTRSVFDRYHIVSTEDVTDAMQAVESASLTNGRKALGHGE